MAELADAPDLGSGVPDVQVQVLSSAFATWYNINYEEDHHESGGLFLKTVAGQKEAATKLLGQTLSKEEIAEKVGKYNNMTVDVNGCTHGVSSVRFFYNGFTIYCRAAKDANDNVIQNQYTLISID